MKLPAFLRIPMAEDVKQLFLKRFSDLGVDDSYALDFANKIDGMKTVKDVFEYALDEDEANLADVLEAIENILAEL